MTPRELVLPLTLLALGCGSGGRATDATPAEAAPRSFALGFGDFPHARSWAALLFAEEVVRRDGDLVVHHFDDGIPWEEAAAGAPYPAGYEAELDRKVRAQPPGHLRYLGVTPIRFLRDGLADRRGEQGTEPLRTPWDRRSFDDPETIAAYGAHCERMIAKFRPDLFAYGVEVNILAQKHPEKWPALVRLLSLTYARIKAQHPALPVFLTFQVDFLQADPAGQAAVIREVMPWSDLAAASTYAYAALPDGRLPPADYFDALLALGGARPFAVAETAWPAEDVGSPHPAFIPGSEEGQSAYVAWLLERAEQHRAVFVNWIIARDYDDLWSAEMAAMPEAPLLRLWKDVGLYRGDGSPRPALATWRSALLRPRL